MEQTTQNRMHFHRIPGMFRTGGKKRTIIVCLVSILMVLFAVCALAAETDEQAQTPDAEAISTDVETTEALPSEQTALIRIEVLDGEAYDSEEADAETSGKSFAPRSATVTSLPSGMKTAIKNAILNCQKSVDVSAYKLPCTQEVGLLIDDYAKNGSPLFFNYYSDETTAGLSIYRTSASTDLTRIEFNYKYTESQYKTKLNQINAVVDSLLNGIRGNSSLGDVEKALLIHDRLALHCEYGGIAKNSSTIDGAFADRKATCGGYAKAYWHLLDQVGIQCKLVESKSMVHMWNIVTVNGKAYHVDVTYDDTASVRDVTGEVMHDNFLRSTNGIKKTGHNASDFTSAPSDTTYDGSFWQKSRTAFVLAGNKIYYIDSSNGALNRYSDKKTMRTVSASWPRLCSDGTNLYYNTNNSLVCYNVSAGTTATVKTFSGSGKYVIGLAYEDGYLIGEYTASASYSSSTKSTDGFRIKYPTTPEYTVSFSANGGSGAPGSQSVTAGNSITLPNGPSTAKSYTVTFDANGGSVSPGTKKYACSFSSWKYNGTSYAPGTSYKPAGNVTFTAAWSNPKLSAPPTPTRSGYTFDYWMLSDGTKVTTSYTITGNVTLYAHWTEIPVLSIYAISFDNNGGSGKRKMVSVEAGSSVTLPDSDFPTRFPMIFSGWATSSTATSPTYLPGKTFTPTKSMTLYAVWKNPSSITATITANPNINFGGRTIYYKIVPGFSGTMTVASSGSYDTYGALYNSSGTVLTSNDDSDGINFKYTYSVKAGTTYYAQVRMYSPTATGSFSVKFTLPKIVQEALDASRVTRTPASIYCGQALPKVTVKNAAGKTLIEGTDYKVTYEEKTVPGSYKLRVDGINSYKGSIYKTYTIKATEALDASRVTRTPTSIYSGQALPKVTVKNAAGKTLTEGTDYKIYWPEKTKPGDYLLRVDGVNAYSGSVRKAYTIKATEALDASRVTRTPTSIFTGQALPKVTVKNAAGKTLKEGTDYKVYWPEKTKPGDYLLRVDGINAYSGSVRKAYSIKEREALDASRVTRTPTTFTYNGKQQQPKVTVKNAAGATLKEGTDYKVTYPTSVKRGEYMVRVDGINGYSGTVRKVYTIK